MLFTIVGVWVEGTRVGVCVGTCVGVNVGVIVGAGVGTPGREKNVGIDVEIYEGE